MKRSMRGRMDAAALVGFLIDGGPDFSERSPFEHARNGMFFDSNNVEGAHRAGEGIEMVCLLRDPEPSIVRVEKMWKQVRGVEVSVQWDVIDKSRLIRVSADPVIEHRANFPDVFFDIRRRDIKSFCRAARCARQNVGQDDATG